MSTTERGPYQKISSELRSKIIQALSKGVQKEQIINSFGVKRTTINSIQRVWIKEGRSEKKVNKGRQPILSDDDCRLIRGWIDENISLTLKQIREKISTELGKNVSLSTIDRAIHGFFYSFKRVSLIPEKRNDERTIQLRYDYGHKFVEMLPFREKIFFVDEYGIQVNSRANYGRSAIGFRANKKVKTIRGKNYSVCAAMSCDGLFFFEAKNSPYNGEHFHIFISQLFEYFRLENIDNAFVVMDNVNFHKTQEVRELFRNSNHEQVFLPPYSPMLNPIENLFSQWKNAIKRAECQNEDELYSKIDQSSTIITKENCINYFRNMEKYITPCLLKQVIEN